MPQTQKPQSAIEQVDAMVNDKIENQETLDGNYFTQVNDEYDRLMLEGELDGNEVDEISDRVSEESDKNIFEKFIDAVKAPQEAMEWFVKSSFLGKMLADSWIGEIFGLKKKVDEAKESVIEAITNPVNIITGILGGAAFMKVFEKVMPGFDKAKLLSKAPSGLLLGGLKRLGTIGLVAAGLLTLLTLFRENPEKAQSMPEDSDEKKNWILGFLEEQGWDDEAEAVAAFFVGEKTADNWFDGEEEVSEDQDQKVELKEGEVTLGEKLQGFENQISILREEVAVFLEKNKEWLSVVAATSVASLTLFSSGGKLTAKALLGMAKLPIKSPIITMFLSAGVLFAYKEAHASTTPVPEDNAEFAKFIKDTVVQSPEWKEFQDLTQVEDATIDASVQYITGEKNLDDLKDSTLDLLESLKHGALDYALLTPNEVVLSQNIRAVNAFVGSISVLSKKDKKFEPFYKEVQKFEKNLRKDGKIDDVDVLRLQNEAKKHGISIFEKDGIIYWAQIDGSGVIQPQVLCLSSKLKIDEAAKIAETLVIDPTATLGFLEAGSIPLRQLRLLGGSLFEKVETEQDAAKVIEMRLKDGWDLMFVGGQLVFAGASERYVLGPLKFWENTISLITSDENFSVTEFAVDYMSGIMPVMVIGLTSKFAADAVRLRNPFKAGDNLKFIGKTMAFPITGTLSVIDFTAKYIAAPLIQKDTGIKDVLENPKNQITSTFKETYYRYKGIGESVVGRYASTKLSERSLYTKNIADLNEALNHLYKLQKSPKMEELHANHARELLEKVGAEGILEKLKGNRIGHANVNEVISYVKEEIKKNELELKALTPEKAETKAGQKSESTSAATEEKGLRAQKGQDSFIGKTRRGIVGFAIGVAGALGLHGVVESMKGKEAIVDLKKLEEKSQASSSAEKESVSKKTEAVEKESSQKTIQQIESELLKVDNAYAPVAELFDPKKLNALSEDQLIKKVDDFLPVHEKNIDHLKTFLEKNRNAIDTFYKENPDQQNAIFEVNQFIAIKYDPDLKRPVLEYADKSDLKSSIYQATDYMRNNMEDLLAGKNPSLLSQAGDVAKYMTPGLGTYLDGKAAVNAFRRGDWSEAAWSSAWTVVGGVADALLIIPLVGQGASLAIRGGRGAAVAGRVAMKAVGAARRVKGFKTATKHIGKVTVGMMGSDIARAFMNVSRTSSYAF